VLNVTNNKDLQSKINALLAKAESCYKLGSDIEGDAFSAKAWALAAKHGLTPGATAESKGDLVIKKVRLRAPYGSSQSILINAVAQSLGCIVVTHGSYYDAGDGVLLQKAPTHVKKYEYGVLVSLFGREDAIESTIALFHSVYLACLLGMNRELDKTPAFRRSYMIGFAQRTKERLIENLKLIETADEEVGLALISALDEAKRFMNNTVSTSTKVTRYQGNGAAAGASAADKIDIGSKRVGAQLSIGAGS
jgi:hypothetical protein